MEGKGRGRARGRARGKKDDSSLALGGIGASPGFIPPHLSSGVDRPGGLQSAFREELDMSGAMASLRLEEDDGNGDEGALKPYGRGTMRGTRKIGSEIALLKPPTVTEKRGKTGDMQMLLGNYFPLETTSEQTLFMYDVKFNPEEDRLKVRKKLLGQYRRVLGAYIFDGQQLFMARRLPDEVTSFAFNQEDGSVCQIEVMFVKEVMTHDPQHRQILSIVLNNTLTKMTRYKQMGRNFCDFDKKIDDRQYNISIVPEYFTSIRQHENNLLLNVDASHKFIRNETCLDVMAKMRNKAECEQLLGSIVMTIYNEKTYRVDDIAWDLNPQSEFPLQSGSSITYIAYYKQRYQIDIRDQRQPLLMSKPKKRDMRRGMTQPLYLIPELCKMTGLTDDMRNNYHTMKSLSSHMKLGPDERVDSLRKFMGELATNEKVQNEFEQWNLKVYSDPVKIQGRSLPAEEIRQSCERYQYNRASSDWSREFREKPMDVAVDLQNWTCIFPVRSGNEAQKLCKFLVNVGSKMGMNINQPDMRVLQRDSNHDYVSALQQCAGQQLVLLVLPNNRLDRYSAIKRLASVNMGIPTQCVLSRTLSRDQRLMSVSTKIAIQINCKLGGEAWNVDIPMQEAFKQCAPNPSLTPRLTFVVVSKRINARFFKASDTPENPIPGTVIDDVVTLPERYDFFLVSQSVREGTVSPTSYNILEDNSGLDADKLQRIAYKLTHLYYNWQGTVRVPAPCLYAHKLAYITGTAIHDVPHRVLAPNLWYL